MISLAVLREKAGCPEECHFVVNKTTGDGSAIPVSVTVEHWTDDHTKYEKTWHPQDAQWQKPGALKGWVSDIIDWMSLHHAEVTSPA